MSGLLDQKPGSKKSKASPAETNQQEAPQQATETVTETPAQQETVPTVSQAVEPYKPATVPASPVSDAGDVSLHGDEIKISIVKIVQPTSKDGTAGCFRNNDTGEEWEELRGNILDVQRGYVDFGSQDASDPFTCASRDTITCKTFSGSDTIKATECPRNPALWAWKDKKPSPCRFSYNFIFNKDDDEVFTLAFHQASSYDSIKTFLTSIATKSTGRNIQKAGLVPGKFYLFPVTVGLKEEKNDKGRFYVATFKLDAEPISPEDAGFFAKRAKTYQGINAMDKVLDQIDKESMPDMTDVDMSDCPI